METDALYLDDMKTRVRIQDCNVRRTRLATDNGWLAEKNRTGPVEGLRQDQKNLAMSSGAGLIDVDYRAIQAIKLGFQFCLV